MVMVVVAEIMHVDSVSAIENSWIFFAVLCSRNVEAGLGWAGGTVYEIKPLILDVQ